MWTAALSGVIITTTAQYKETAMEIVGRVISGKGLGRRLGFPTANLSIDQAAGIAYGVYSAKAEVAGRWHAAVLNVGEHPTLPEGLPTVEVYILDEPVALYGEDLRVILLRYLRPEQKFNNIDELREQIGRDVEQAREDANQARP